MTGKEMKLTARSPETDVLRVGEKPKDYLHRFNLLEYFDPPPSLTRGKSISVWTNLRRLWAT